MCIGSLTSGRNSFCGSNFMLECCYFNKILHAIALHAIGYIIWFFLKRKLRDNSILFYVTMRERRGSYLISACGAMGSVGFLNGRYYRKWKWNHLLGVFPALEFPLPGYGTQVKMVWIFKSGQNKGLLKL